MIGEKAFKGLCEHAASGLPIRALFITRDAIARKLQHQDMLAEATSRDLNVIWYDKDRTLKVGPATVYMRVAHPRLDQELTGLEWHFIHGLEYVLDLPDGGDAIAANLTMMARL